MKKVLSVLLAIVLLGTCLPLSAVSVSAATSGKTGDCTWKLDGTHLTISGKGAMESEIYDAPWGKTITKVTVKEGVTGISDYAFYGCTKLSSVTLPKSLVKIGYNAFASTGLTSVTIPSKVTSVYYDTFSGEKLTSISVAKDNAYLSSENGVLFNKKKTKLILCPPGKSGAYAIPDSVTAVGEYAFNGCRKLTKVTFGKKVKTIGDSAFSGCIKLTSVSIPDSVTSMELGAFAYCENLKSVTIGKGLKEIINVPSVSDLTPPFGGCNKLTSISVSKDNPYLSSANGVLFNKAKTKLLYCPAGKSGAYTVPNTVTTIEECAFNGCNKITSITVSDSVKTIKTAALNHCENLKKVSLGKNVKTFEKGYYGWYYESIFGENPKMTTLTVSKNNPYFTAENGVLFNKKKTQIILCLSGKSGSYVIPDGVTTIKECAFASCENLNAVALPTSVKAIEVEAFGWGLQDIYYTGTKTQAGKIDDACSSEWSPFKWHYNTCKTHAYSNKCDKTCNKCDWIRTITHTYKVVSTKKATATANGYIQKKCSVCGATTKTTLYKASKISLSATSYTYDGKVKKPTITVKDSKGNKITTSNYTVTYASGRKNVGTYKVTVKFKGNYSGTKTLTFKINPAKTSLSSLTAGAKKLTVKWAKKTTQVTGYQIQYSTSKSFSSYKSKTITKNSTVSTALTGLSAKKTYYVRVRTYKTVNGVKIYSGWSTVKSLKTK